MIKVRIGVYILRVLGIAFAAILLYETYFVMIPRHIWDLDYIYQSSKIIWSLIGFFGISFMIYAIVNAINLILYRLLAYPPYTLPIITESAQKFLSSFWGIPSELMLPEISMPESPFLILSMIYEILEPFIFSILIILAFIAALSFLSYLITQSTRAAYSILLVTLITLVICHFIGEINISLNLSNEYDFLKFITQRNFIYLILYFGFLLYNLYLDYIRRLLDPAVLHSKFVERQIEQIKKQAAVDTLVKGTLPVSFYTRAKYSVSAFNFIREIIEKRIFRRKGLKEELVSIHEIRKLNAYLTQIAEKTPHLIRSLKGEFAYPSFLNIILIAAISIIIHFFIFAGVSYIVINPQIVYSYVQVSPQILESVDILAPEFSIMILLPFATTIPIIATIISFLKRRKLKKLKLKIPSYLTKKRKK